MNTPFNVSLALSVSATLLLVSCASVHPGIEARSLAETSSLPVKVSAQAIGDPQGTPFQLFEITIENLSDEWVRAHKVQLVIADPAVSRLSVVMGSDLRDWAKATQARLQLEQHNREMLQLALVGAGAVASSFDGDLGTIGKATVGGTSVWAVADVINQSRDAAEKSGSVPENHLYSPFAVPGKMFLRRWVLLNKPAQYRVTRLVMQVEAETGARETYDVVL